MRTIVTLLCIWMCSFSYADQLAYISKADADRAVQKISKMGSVYLYCGCCSLIAPQKIKPIRVYSKFTNYESYYEVFIVYLDEDGLTREKAVDLAYVWKKGLFGAKTIGKILGLEHDPCVKMKNWDNPKNADNED
ncbi:MAG: hypothetical protein ACI837_003381 [Crocinitomicaceae bacterium]|jgi:hypothetical protein